MVQTGSLCIFFGIGHWNVGWIGLVWFYGISTIVGYLMPNPVYSYILDMICKHKSTKLNSSMYYYI